MYIESQIRINAGVNLYPVVETNSFVKLLFEVLSSGEYDASLKAKLAAAKAAPPVTKEPVVIPVTRVHASNSGSSIGSHGDVDMRLSRPGAVVQPLVSGNNGMSEEDYRHGDVYRSGHDTHQHGEPQQRRDWKRRSPQRTVRHRHHLQGDHLSGKPGNVREFDVCHGNVGDFTKSQGIVMEMSGKISSGKSGLKLYIFSCIFVSIQIFSRSLFCVKY